VSARIFTLLLALPLAGACTHLPTPYQPRGPGGGYEESRLGERVYRISCTANAYTAEPALIDCAFLRAAELTRAAGFSHFVVVRQSGTTDVEAMEGERFRLREPWDDGRMHMGVMFPTMPEYVYFVRHHLVVMTIRMLTAAEAPGEKDGLEAAYILRSLGEKLKPGSGGEARP
jgi:hypothetical protein